MKRKTGFYWCNIGRVRGTPTDWVVCYYDETFSVWHIPVYKQLIRLQGEMEYFEEIDETRLVYHKEHKTNTK